MNIISMKVNKFNTQKNIFDHDNEGVHIVAYFIYLL